MDERRGLSAFGRVRAKGGWMKFFRDLSIPRAGTFLAVLACWVLAASATSARSQPQIRLLDLQGMINPLTARYLHRGLALDDGQGVDLLIVRLDTPGGLASSMQDMIQDILNSPTPVVVYIAPPGAGAASAGMFLTIAAHVAAMAPGTHIGAAHPVGIGGGSEKEVMTAKVVNDAVSLARSIAEVRGRNAAWVESAVRQSVSITAAEALKLDVIDLVAPDLDALLAEIDGREVTTSKGKLALRTAGVLVEQMPMTLIDRILQAIADPNIAYLLFSLGTIGLIAEFYSPGLIFPGIFGAVALILALVSFGSLPLNWGGLLLLALGIALFVAEALNPGIGILGVGGLVSFVLGSLILYRPFGPASPALPTIRVSPWLIALMSLLIVAMLGFVLQAVVKSRRLAVVTGAGGLIGRTARAVTALAPSGIVDLDGERWSASAEREFVQIGEEVIVAGVAGVTLRVVKRDPGVGALASAEQSQEENQHASKSE